MQITGTVVEVVRLMDGSAVIVSVLGAPTAGRTKYYNLRLTTKQSALVPVGTVLNAAAYPDSGVSTSVME